MSVFRPLAALGATLAIASGAAASATPPPVLSPSTLDAYLWSYAGQASITLPPGDYVAGRLNSKAFPPGFVLDLNGATLHSQIWYAVSNVTITNGTISGGFTCSTCKNITFDGIKAVPEGQAGGISWILGDGLTVKRSEFIGAGVYPQRATNIEISDNLFHDMMVDAVDYPAVCHIKIQRNAVWGGRPNPGSHPDAFQYWDVAGWTGCDATVTDNYVDAHAQGVFHVPNGSTVAHNMLALDFQNAIWVPKGVQAILDDNHVYTLEGSTMQATILWWDNLTTFEGTNTVGAWRTKPAKVVP